MSGQRQERRYLTKRAPVDPRVSFDVTTPQLDVVARTTDPMVFPGKSGGRWRRLAEALGVVHSTLPVVEQATQLGIERDYQEGAMSALKGEERPSTGLAKIRGWETLKGELTARREFRDELENFFNENHLKLTPEEFEQGVWEISQRYVQGASPSFLEGFLKSAINIEQSIYDRYNQAQAEMVRIESQEMLSNKAYDFAYSMLENTFRDTFGLDSLENIFERPDILKELYVNGAELKQSFTQQLRDNLTEAQLIGKDLGFRRHEVNMLYLDQVGRLAIRYGIPELLDFLRVPDENGVAPISSSLTGKQVFQYLEQAESVQKARITEYDKALAKAEADEKARLEKEKEQYLEDLYTSVSLDVSALEKLAEVNPALAASDALKLFEVLLDNDHDFRYLSSDRRIKIHDRLLDLIAADTAFVEKSDKQTITNLNRLVREENLTADVIYESRELLSREDWDYYWDQLSVQQEKKFKEFQKDYYSEVLHNILTIRELQDNPQELALSYLLLLEGSDAFWQLDPEDTLYIREELIKIIKSDTTFAVRNDGEFYTELMNRKADGLLTRDRLMEARPYLTEATWTSFFNEYLRQEELKREAERKAQEEELRLLEEQAKETRQERVKEYDRAIQKGALLPSKQASAHYNELLEMFDNDSIAQTFDPDTYRRILNEIIDGIVANNQYATTGNADHHLFEEMLERAKDLDLTRDEIQEVVDARLITQAQHRSLLDALRKAEADEKARLEKKEEEARKKAEQAKKEAQAAAERDALARAEKAMKDSLKNLYVQLHDITLLGTESERVARARELREILRQEDQIHNFEPSVFKSIDSHLAEIIGGELQFPTHSKRQVVAELETDALLGTLDVSTIMGYMNSGDLNASDFRRFLSAYEAQEEEEYRKLSTEDAQIIKDHIRNIINLVVGADPYVVPLSGVQQATASSLDFILKEEIRKFKEAHERPPSVDEFLRHIAEPVLIEHGYSLSELVKVPHAFETTRSISERPMTFHVTPEDLQFSPVEVPRIFGRPRIEYVENPEFRLSREEAFFMMKRHFDEGLPVPEVLKRVNEELVNSGRSPLESELAQDYYLQNYVDNAFWGLYIEHYDKETGRVPIKYIDEMITRLDALGFTKNEIISGAFMGQYRFQLWLEEQGGR